MPKQEVGSTKWLGNKMKAKGLQKLRWYCQMCQKQCRDENGFKCHRMSDGHQRQMQLFVQDPNRFMDEFSQEFERGFMQLMSHTYRSQRVLANTVYCDFISNRHHTHMNSTIWVTLSNFVQYLGRTNQCTIDKTPKGWYIQYVDNSPEARMRAAAQKAAEELEVSSERRHAVQLQRAIEECKKDGGFQDSEFTELQRKEGDAPIAFNMPAGSSSAASAPSNAAKAAVVTESEKKNVLAEAFEEHESKSIQEGNTRKLSAVEKIKLEHEDAKRRKLQQEAPEAPESPSESSSSGNEPWLCEGIIVKVMHQELAGGKYYRKKGKVERVRQQFAAEIRMAEGRDLIRLDQEMLETVIPNLGKPVMVVKGQYAGKRARMRSVDLEAFCVSIEFEDSRVVEGLRYDQVCKIDE
ncbi:unnamed protein product [Effrenium voratum]|uniref:DNA/RNA-binding protein Kin17 WH-like domain-containing protein n=1 Tax=Effrenium voratum TaxID=2562239 RepID=A0AA36JNA0_9DINO|nr:unnamed protein product [Effrenium voratum]|mmetsp:Transcript_69542/g.165868  ORF Transcript_69542/g.165868 Transcript_69542/m.165868 type:complete len:408 (+) Transcript_69542:50-1273(+)